MAKRPSKYPFKFVMSLPDRMGRALQRLGTREERPYIQIVRELIADRVGMGRKGIK